MADSVLRRAGARISSTLNTVHRSSLARAALVTGSLTILCKILGFAKELQVAARFGVGPTLDTYLIAVVIPNLISNVFAISFASSVVMQLIRNQTNSGEDVARERFASSMFWGLIFIVSVASTGVLLGPVILPWLSLGFRPELQSATQDLLWLLLPYTLLSGISSVWSSILSARGRVAAAALSPGFVSIGVMTMIWVWQISEAKVLVTGLTIGAFVDVCVLGYCMRLEGLPRIPRPGHWHPEDGWIVAQTIPMIIASMLRFSSTMIDQSMASMLGEGCVSELNYGSRWVAMAQGLISLPLGKIIFPHFVQLVEHEQWVQVRTMLRRSMLLLILVSTPVTVALAGFSGPLVQWTFQRGQFSDEMTTRVAAVQVMYALQFPFYLWSALLGRLVIAMQMRRVFLGCGVLNVTMNITLNLVLMQRFGVTGIALSTALVYLSAACYFSVAIHRALSRKIREKQPFRRRESQDSGPFNETRHAA